MSELLVHERIGKHDATRIAVRGDDAELTYRQLDERSADVAAWLARHGVARGDVVLVHATRCVELVVALVGVWKAGAAFAISDAAYPVARLAAQARVARPKAIVTAGASLELADGALPVLSLSASGVSASGLSGPAVGDGASVAHVDKGDLAYVAFTSGTTGVPKGILGAHGPLTHFLKWHVREHAMSVGDRFAMTSGLSHDPLLRDVFTPLWLGATLHVPGQDLLLQPSRFARWVGERGISVLHLTPTLASVLVEGAKSAAIELGLRAVFFGGERLTKTRATEMRRVAPGALLVNFYGATETPQAMSAYVVPADGGAQEAVPIGKGIDEVELLVLDGNGRSTGPGEVGEIVVRTRHLALGYRVDEGASGFAPGAYRTGDLGRRLRDGNVECLGRRDDQVKIRGYRVEPLEVEAALRRQPGVSDAFVLADRRADDVRLIGYAVSEIEPAVLRERLAKELPAFLVPAVVVAVNALPRTPNGKIDRRALPKVPWVAKVAYLAPRDEPERAIAEVWQAVLRVDRVGVHDDFFALGGHSLLATQVVSKLRERLGVEVPLRALFEAPTVALLGKRVASAASARAFTKVPRGERSALSYAQERLWFLDQLEPGSTAYHMGAALRLEGELDVAALERALNEVVARHEVLRTTFAVHDGVAHQVVHAPGTTRLEPERVTDVEAEARAAWSQPFDLTKGPLFRQRLLRASTTEHLLVLVLHHIVSDGWSTGVLVREVAALYAGNALPALSVQYADYAAWQRTHAERIEREAAYWKGQLAGAPTLLELPTDRPRPSVQSLAGATVDVLIGAEQAAALDALAKAHDATLFMVLLATWQLVLSRYSGQKDIVVGSPIANRTMSELEPLIGFFVNTLALRTSLAGDPTFVELLRRVRETTLAAYEHQEVPFERVVETVNPPRSMSHAPLFQAVLALQNTPETALVVPGLTLSALDVERGAAKFDLTLLLAQTERGLEGTLDYATSIFDRATVERLLESWRVLLSAITNAPATRISRLPIVTTADRARLLDEWNSEVDDLPPSLLHELFMAQAARTPDAPAAVLGDTRRSYRELDERSNELAHVLKARGVGRGDRVGIVACRSLALIEALLAIPKAGGAYVSIDGAWPAERTAGIAKHLELRALVIDAEHLGRLDEYRACGWSFEIVVLLADATRAEAASRAPLPRVVTPADPAYVIHTSGSTGEPKGVLVDHGAATRLVRWVNDTFAVGPRDRLLFVTSICFDLSVYDVFGILAAGGTVHVASSEDLAEPGRLVRALQRDGITIWDSAPAALQRLAPSFEGKGSNDLRLVLLSGDWIPLGLPDDVRASYPAAKVVSLGGATEATIWSNYFPVRDVDKARKSIPYGYPITNARYYGLDADLEPVPFGVVGDLYIGGACLAVGYERAPSLTADRFIPDPHAPSPGGRMYRTGDLVRRGVDGCLEFMGRADAQVKVRGFRIELGEIEAALSADPRVRAAAVVARGTRFDRRLVAYVVGDVTADELEAYLRGLLPEYMIPSAFVALDALPMTANGKLDRNALPEPELATAEYVAPRDANEVAVAALWRGVLGVERVGVKDDFFALGGHSLLATQVLSKVRAKLGVELPLRALFEATTVEAFARRVAVAAPSTMPELAPRARGEHPRLSFAQERLWFLDQLEPGSTAYLISAALRLEGELDVDALEAVLGHVVARHESLRTTFALHEGVPCQVVHEAEPASLRGEAIAREDVTEALRAEFATPFDLERGPLLRARLLRVSPREHVLSVVMHHIVSDGWSIGVLVREVAALYAGAVLEPLAVQYADYATWQRARETKIEAETAYWKTQLAGAPSLLELPTDRPRPAAQSYVGATVPVRLSVAQTTALRALAKANDATLFMVLLAAWQLVLARYSGQKDVVVGGPIANRTLSEVEPLVGFFANTLALRTDVSSDPTFEELLARVRETTLEAYENQEVPFERVVEALNPPRSLSYTPLFQVLFAFQNAPTAVLAMRGVQITPVESAHVVAKFDLTLNLFESEGRIEGSLEYATALFEAASARRFVKSFEAILRAVTSSATVRTSELELEQPHAMEPARPSRHALVHDYLEEQARVTPDRLAVVDGAERLTYRELDERASRFAAHLQSLGVGEEDRVALALPRGVGVAVALLGIWKAGATSVMLDLANPDARLGVMLREGDVRFVVAQDATLARFAGTRVVRLADSASASPTYARRGHAESLHYVVYTSGSTGEPKGVALPHRVLVTLLEHEVTTLPHGQRTQQFASLGFDVSLQEIACTLASGGTLFFLDEETRTDVEALGRTMTTREIERAYFPVVMLQQLAEQFADDVGSLGSLRDVIVAGEQLVVTDAIVRLFARLSGARLHNHYGPSETHVVTTLTLDGDPRTWPRHVPIGQHIPNDVGRVLNESLALQPPGAIGELYLAGASVGRGYLGRAELTGERFVPDPYGEPGDRMYRTGDLARVRTDGALEYLGRADQQVKVRGFRIELGEIEAALARLEGVRTAAVVVRGTDNQRRLVAYVAGDAQPAALRDGLRRTLPEYMVPATCVVLDHLPLTTSGKVDRKALPEPALERSESVEPRDERERAVAKVWREVLRIDHAGVHDDFFEMGGHSLLATRLMSRLRREFQVELPLRVLFDEPTVARLSAAIAGASKSVPLPPVRRRAADEPPVVSLGQEAYFGAIERRAPQTVLAIVGTILGPLDVAALRVAATRVVMRHETLRSRFTRRQGRVVVEISPSPDFPFEVLELEGASVEERRAHAHAIIDAIISEPGTPATPVLTLTLLPLSPNEHIVLIRASHMVFDAPSRSIFSRELLASYACVRRGELDSLPPLPFQFADWALWQREIQTHPSLEASRAYWTRKLEGAVPVSLPRRTTSDETEARFEAFVIDALLYDRIAQRTRETGTTFFHHVAAAFSLTLESLLRQHDYTFLSSQANRHQPGAEALIGFFLNTMFLRIKVEAGRTLEQFLARVRYDVIEDQGHADLAVASALGIDRKFLTVNLAYASERGGAGVDAPLQLPEDGLTFAEVHRVTSRPFSTQFDLALWINDNGNAALAAFGWQLSRLSEAEGRRFMRSFRHALARLVSRPTLEIDALLDELRAFE